MEIKLKKEVLSYRKIIKVSVTTLLLFFAIFELKGQDLQLRKLLYKNCDIAFDSAVQNVRDSSIIVYVNVGDGDMGDEPQYSFVDSVLTNIYGFRVDRNRSIHMDYTKNCYNKFIKNHFDSAYNDKYLVFRIFEQYYNKKRDE